MESKGFIKLPARKCTPPNPLAKRKKTSWVIVDKTPVHCSVEDLFHIKLDQVRRTPFEKIFNGLVSEYHYLGYTQPVGEHLKYIAFSHNRPIACLAWGSAPWYIEARDRFIG
ncbi:MAG: Druantia anti-phage system protein DruA [Dissulfuribacterales bacterium]